MKAKDQERGRETKFSRSMTVKNTEARKRGKIHYDVGLTEVDKVNKKIKIHFAGSIACNLTSGDFSPATRYPTTSTYFQLPFSVPNLSLI